jgi:hypothetical protein
MSTELIKLIHKQILSVAYKTDQINTGAKKKNSTGCQASIAGLERKLAAAPLRTSCQAQARGSTGSSRDGRGDGRMGGQCGRCGDWDWASSASSRPLESGVSWWGGGMKILVDLGIWGEATGREFGGEAHSCAWEGWEAKFD